MKEILADALSNLKMVINKTKLNLSSSLDVKSWLYIVLIPVISTLIIYFSYPIFLLIVIGTLIYSCSTLQEVILATEEKTYPVKKIGFFYLLLSYFSILYIINQPKGTSLIFWLFLLTLATKFIIYVLEVIVGGPIFAKSLHPTKTLFSVGGTCIFGLLMGVLVAIVLKGDLTLFMFLNVLMTILIHLADILTYKMTEWLNIADDVRLKNILLLNNLLFCLMTPVALFIFANIL